MWPVGTSSSRAGRIATARPQNRAVFTNATKGNPNRIFMSHNRTEHDWMYFSERVQILKRRLFPILCLLRGRMEHLSASGLHLDPVPPRRDCHHRPVPVCTVLRAPQVFRAARAPFPREAARLRLDRGGMLRRPVPLLLQQPIGDHRRPRELGDDGACDCK